MITEKIKVWKNKDVEQAYYNGCKDKEKDIEKELKEVHLQIDELSEFVRILMLGHKTEKRHKNIFYKMYRTLTKFYNKRKEKK